MGRKPNEVPPEGPINVDLPAATAKNAEEAAVLAADAAQRDAVAAADLTAIAAIAHPNFRVNAPNGQILTKGDIVRMVGSGAIRNDEFERIPETVVVTGAVAVVMGREVVLPGPGSVQAQIYGERSLVRRYTNIFLCEDDIWRTIARHSNIVG